MKLAAYKKMKPRPDMPGRGFSVFHIRVTASQLEVSFQPVRQDALLFR